MSHHHRNPNSSSPGTFGSLFTKNSPELQHRIQNTINPSVLQVLPTRATVTSFTRSSSSSAGAAASLNNNNNNRYSSAAGNALAAIRKNNSNNRSINNSSSGGGGAQASPELLRNWREPFQALQRLEERAHQLAVEESKKSVGAYAFSSESQNNILNNASSAASSSQFAKKFGFLPSRALAMQNHFNNNGTDSSSSSSDPNFYLQLLNNSAAQQKEGNNDPMAQLDRLYSKAKRKWVDLCVTLRVPEEERKIIEKQISRRDDVPSMNTCLEILHSEIERLIEMFHWGGILRKSIEEREKYLVSFFSFISEFSCVNNNNSSSSSNLPPIANLDLLRSSSSSPNNNHQKTNNNTTGRSTISSSSHHLRNNNSSKQSIISSLAPTADVCLKILERLLHLRYLTADVYTAHRKWQVAHGATNPSVLYLHKGSSYLEKIMQDFSSSVIDTDSSDMDRAIQREKRRAERVEKEQEQDLFIDGNDDDETNHQENTARSSNNNSNTKFKKYVSSSSPNSSIKRNTTTKQQNSTIARSSSSSESFVIRQLPDWLFSLTIFRVSRQNPLIDVRKRRSLPMFPSRHEIMMNASSGDPKSFFVLQQQQQQKLEAAKDFDENDIYQQLMLETYLPSHVQQMMEKSDEVLSKMLLERCGWTIDDYFLSANRSLNDVKSQWRQETQILQQRINEIAPNPAKTGAVRTEFLRDLEAGCNFVVGHEQQVIDLLVERSIQQGMYGDEEQQARFNQVVEELNRNDSKTLAGRRKSSIHTLMEASQVMMMRSMNSSSGSPFNRKPSSSLTSGELPKQQSADTTTGTPAFSHFRALIVIQSAVRKFLARKVARQLWREKLAATAIQSVIRRFLCRCRTAKIRRRARAASRIQAFYRACVTRRAIASDLQTRRAARDRRLDLERQNKLRENRLHDQIQYQKLNPNRVLLLNNRAIEVSVHQSVAVGKSGKSLREYLGNAATKIQAAYRGHVEYWYGMGVDVREWRMFLHINRAAAKIQALARGVAVRKELVFVKSLLADVKMIQRIGRAYLSRWKDLW